MIGFIEHESAPVAELKTPRRDWYRDARVRSGPRPRSIEHEGALFAVELAPHAAHPIAHGRGEDVSRELLRLALVRYLHATSVLEIRVVNAVAAELAHGELGRDLHEHARIEALQLTCDEGWHALQASELLSQIGGEREPDPPAFLARLGALRARRASTPAESSFIRFLFTVVTETALSANMRQLARSVEVAPAVRDFVADHARDEAWHAVFFSSLFALRWARLTEAERRRYGQLFADLIHAYLAPDVAAVTGDLHAAGLSAAEAAAVVAESYGGAQQREAVRRAAHPVIACLRRAGALTGEAHGSLVRAGLLEG